jgi:hypothetical protein
MIDPFLILSWGPEGLSEDCPRRDEGSNHESSSELRTTIPVSAALWVQLKLRFCRVAISWLYPNQPQTPFLSNCKTEIKHSLAEAVTIIVATRDNQLVNSAFAGIDGLALQRRLGFTFVRSSCRSPSV